MGDQPHIVYLVPYHIEAHFQYYPDENPPMGAH